MIYESPAWQIAPGRSKSKINLLGAVLENEGERERERAVIMAGKLPVVMFFGASKWSVLPIEAVCQQPKKEESPFGGKNVLACLVVEH